MLSSRAVSGANSSESSAWKLDTSQTTVTSAPSSPTSDDSGVPTLPATATGRPAARQIAPSSSAVVVLPFVPVTATKRTGSSRQASSSSPSTGSPTLARRADHGRLVRDARALDDAAHALEQLDPVALEDGLDARGRLGAAAVHAQHLPVRQQHAGRRGARARQPNDQIRPLGEGRPHGVIDAW